MKWLLLSSFANEESDEDQKRRKERREKTQKARRGKEVKIYITCITRVYVYLCMFTHIYVLQHLKPFAKINESMNCDERK